MSVIVITGSTRGVGFDLACRLIKENNWVVVHGKTRASVDDAMSRLEAQEASTSRTHSCAFDLAEGNPVRLIDEVVAKFGRIDVLVNNAAVAVRDEDDRDPHLKVNALVPHELTIDAIRRGATRVINISSGAAITHTADYCDYSLSKALLEVFTRQTALRYPHATVMGCRIDATVDTDMGRSTGFPITMELCDTMPLLLYLLRAGPEASGRIYSTSRAQKNLFLETKFNNPSVGSQYSECLYDIDDANAAYPTMDEKQSVERRIARHLACDEKTVTIAHGGISGAFDFLCGQFITDPGDEVVCHTLTFSAMLRSIVNRQGVVKSVTPTLMNSMNIDYKLDDIVDLITPATKMVYLVHPTYIFTEFFSKADWDKLLSRVPKNVPIVVDECYIEYFASLRGTLDYIDSHFVIGLRSFSKWYGLANCRIGFILASAKYKQVLQSDIFFKSIPSKSLTAVTTLLDDSSRLNEIRNAFEKEHKFMCDGLRKMAASYKGSFPYILVFLPPSTNAELVDKEFTKNKIRLPPTGAVYTNTVLFQIKTRKYNKNILHTLALFFQT